MQNFKGVAARSLNHPRHHESRAWGRRKGTQPQGAGGIIITSNISNNI